MNKRQNIISLLSLIAFILAIFIFDRSLYFISNIIAISNSKDYLFKVNNDLSLNNQAIVINSKKSSNKTSKILGENKTISFNIQNPNNSTWKPPIGIPRPEFGIEESINMYKLSSGENCQNTPNKCFNYGNGLQPYHANVLLEPYTHFVEPTNSRARDTDPITGAATDGNTRRSTSYYSSAYGTRNGC